MALPPALGATGVELTPDERAAVRAYLQRTEVRLSTVHRVASALLSGAGLLVLLPSVARDSVVDVVHGLLRGRPGVADGFLVVAVGALLAVPSFALVVLLRDLTRFYFHANHVSHAHGETFAPRFTLTALRLPADELGADAAAELAAARGSTAAIELLVPANDASRAHVDRRLSVYGLDLDVGEGDPERAGALFALAASHPRDLLEEVAKVEHGLARHVLRVQTIVLRYVKALLALLTTAMAVFAAAAVVDGSRAVGATDGAWLAGIVLVWAPTAMWAVTGPVRWLEGQLRGEGATSTAVSADPDLAGVEVMAVRLALVGSAAAGVAMVIELLDEASSTTARVAGGATLAVTLVLVGAVLWRWAGRATVPQLFARA